MTCNNVQNRMVSLFDKDVDQKELELIHEHLASCADCKQEFEALLQTFNDLKPVQKIIVHNNFKNRVLNQIKENKKMENNNLKISSKWKKITIIAAASVLALIVIPLAINKTPICTTTACAAENIFNKSIKAIAGLKSLYIKLKIRTLPNDNFELIGTQYDFVDHEIWESFETPNRWRIEKQGRVVVMDGKNSYLYIKNVERAIKASPKAGFVEWLKTLLNPSAILETEKMQAISNNAKYTTEDKKTADGTESVLLTIISKAQGDYSQNDYLKNSSILESDNRRIYEFDKNTDLLKSLKVYITNNGQETLVLDLTEIKYNIEVPQNIFAIELPENVNWTKEEKPNAPEFKNISPEEVATIFFKACSDENWKKIEPLCSFFRGNSDKVTKAKNYFAKLEVISIGKSFKSGLYKGVFVPYEIKFKNGEVKKFNLAIRNDNPDKVWQVDGGF